MIQEYLFMDATYRDAVEEYSPDKAKIDFFDIENSTCWIAQYTMEGENGDSAKELSLINDYIVRQFKPTILTNESSAYYNKKLFPDINEFERKLRKLLYLKSAIYHGDKKIDNIRNLETKELGVIFELLFTDADFVKNARSKVNEKTWQFTKREIVAALQSIAEDTLWNDLLGNEAVVSLSDNFLTVKNYRNDVMHAHNIDTKTFRDAKRLFGDINTQLDEEIGRILQTAQRQPETTESSDYNDTLNAALQTYNLSGMTQVAKEIADYMAGLDSETIRAVALEIQKRHMAIDYSEIQDTIKKALEAYSNVEIEKTLQRIIDTQKVEPGKQEQTVGEKNDREVNNTEDAEEAEGQKSKCPN